MMTSTIRKFGVGVASLALVASATAPAFADNRQEVPGPLDGIVKTDRLGGFDRIETAIKIAEKAFEKNNKIEVAYIAGAADAAAVDSAAAGHLSDGPLYLVAGDGRSQDAVAKSINDNYPNVQKIVAIGGTAVVSDATLKGVADSVNAAYTARLSGADRYGTAAAIAEYGATNNGLSEGVQWSTDNASKVYIARGDNPVDALVSGVLTDAPVLLLGPDGTVPEATAAYLKKHLPTEFVALGGEKAVPTSSFLKADFDPVMRNVWLNNEDVEKALAAKREAEFLLEGVPGGTSVNPKHTLDFHYGNVHFERYSLSDAEYMAKKQELADKKAELRGKEEALEAANDAAQQNVKAKKQAAVAHLVANPTANDKYKAYDEARKYYYGVNNFSTETRSATSDYKGSYQIYKEAEQRLVDFEKAQEIKAEIDAALDTYLAADSANKNNAAGVLKTTVEKYIIKFTNGTDTAVEVSTMTTQSVADQFVKAWFGGASTRADADWAKGGLKGFAASTGASANSAYGAGASYDPVATYKDNAARGPMLVKQLKANDATDFQAADRSVTVTFLGLNAASGLEKSALEQAKAAAKAQADADEAAGSEAKKEAAIQDFLDNSSETTAKAYRDVMNAASTPAQDAARKAVRELKRAIAQLQEELDRGQTWNNGFMGYKRIEQKYSLLDGEHAHAMKAINATINERISQLKNATRATVEVVGNDKKMQGWVKSGYGIDLNASNVEKYFAFKSPNRGETPVVFRANFSRMAETADANNLVGRAKELINEFYAEYQTFNTGTMLDWFNPYDDSKNWRKYSKLYKAPGMTQESKKKYDDSAKAVWDALNSDTNRSWWYVQDATHSATFTGRVLNSAGRNAAARVANYLEDIALNNRKTVEANLAKAKLALQAALDKVTPKRYYRVEGSDRYNTSAAIAAYWRATWEGLGKKNETTSVYIANGISYIDAVAGGQLPNGPIVLVAPDGSMTDAVKQRFSFAKTDANVLTITALGGTKAVPDQALTTAVSAARDKSLQGKNFFTDATNKAAKDKADEKKADEKK